MASRMRIPALKGTRISDVKASTLGKTYPKTKKSRLNWRFRKRAMRKQHVCPKSDDNGRNRTTSVHHEGNSRYRFDQISTRNRKIQLSKHQRNPREREIWPSNNRTKPSSWDLSPIPTQNKWKPRSHVHPWNDRFSQANMNAIDMKEEKSWTPKRTVTVMNILPGLEIPTNKFFTFFTSMKNDQTCPTKNNNCHASYPKKKYVQRFCSGCQWIQRNTRS
jgi:hypothetical protein